MYDKEVKNSQMDTSNIINKAELLERVDNDFELLQELLSVFVEDIPQQLKELEESINDSDCERIRALIHRLKGAVGNLAAEDAYELAAKMEMHASQGEISSVQYFYPNLKKQILLVIDALEFMVKNNGF
jgi:HPt (histidine-containing phosphotransfer) domain-containing protein